MGVDQWVNCKHTSLRVPVGILRVCIIKMDMVELPLNSSIYRHRQKIQELIEKPLDNGELQAQLETVSRARWK